MGPLLNMGKQQIQLLQLVTTYTLRVLQSCCKVNNKYNASPWTLSADCPGEALFIVVSMQQPLVRTGLEEAISWRSCSITWHSFSPWHNLSKLSSAHGLPKELLLVVKVVQVVFYVSTSNHSIFRKNLIVEHQKCKYCLLKHQLYDACTKRDAGATAMVSHNIMYAERLHKAAYW